MNLSQYMIFPLDLACTINEQPWFLDGKLTCRFRDKDHIDGSFLAQESDYMPRHDLCGTKNSNSRPVLTLDWKLDEDMRNKGLLDFIKTVSPNTIWGFLERGKAHARIMEERGEFQSIDKLAKDTPQSAHQ